MAITITLLVVVSLGLGAFASHWPFWNRAWQWQFAHGEAPSMLPGPRANLSGGGAAVPPLHWQSNAQWQALAQRTQATVLLWADGNGKALAHYAENVKAESQLDGRGLSAALVPLLHGVLLQQGRAPQLDLPLRRVFPEWENDRRGDISFRHLYWQLSGLNGGSFWPLNPFSRQAQLLSGPNFERAARRTRQRYPAGSHYEPTAANLQLAAVALAAHTQEPLLGLLEQQVWKKIARADAAVMLDHLRGDPAAHCCLRALPEDWLRIGLWVAQRGRLNHDSLIAESFVQEVAKDSPVHPGLGLVFSRVASEGSTPALMVEDRGRLLVADLASGTALLWVGEGSLNPSARQELIQTLTAGPGLAGPKP